MLTVPRADVGEVSPCCGAWPRIYIPSSTRADDGTWLHEVLLICPRCRHLWSNPIGLSGDGVLRVA